MKIFENKLALVIKISKSAREEKQIYFMQENTTEMKTLWPAMAWLGGLKGFYFGTSTRNSFSQRFPLPLATFFILASFSFIPVTPHRSNAQCMATNQTRSGSSFWPKTKTRNQIAASNYVSLVSYSHLCSTSYSYT